MFEGFTTTEIETHSSLFGDARVHLRHGGQEQHRGVVVLSPQGLQQAQPVQLDLGRFEGLIPEEMLGRTRFPQIGSLPYLLTLAPRGFYWFRLVPE